ncbi:MAG: SAM-dependent MidA family methyltransferase, partial [Candidatus Marinamargulisbacteria bacterium]
MIRIHAPLPRFQSLRMQLSSLSWQRGISNFFLEGVPFSFSVGKELADQITQSLVFAMKEMSDQKKQFSVLEFGAGLGGLSKHVLDLMKIHHPDYYARCTFHITDASEEIVKQIQSSGLFADHKDRILCYPLGFGALPKSTKIDFVFMSYLLDSLASRMIEVKNNQIYEVLVTTVIPKETRLFDTAQLPPRVLSPESIRRAYQDADKETLFRISSKLARILKEQWVRIPLDKSTMRDADKREIRRYVSKMPEVGNIRFNYSPLISQGIRQIVSRFGDFGLGFIFDFGSTRPQAAPKPGKLVSKYGVTAFSNVSFPYLTFLCESEGCEVSMSTFKEGNSQLFWFHKGLNKQRAETSFKLLTLAERGTLI